MQNLEAMTHAAKSYKTYAGAEKKLQLVKDINIIGVVLHRRDGTFVPVVFVNALTIQYAGALAHAGIFVIG